MLSRRTFLAAGSVIPLAAARPPVKLGVMDGVLQASGKPEAVALAKRFGLEGVQVTLGRPLEGSRRLPLEDPALQRAWLGASKEHGIPLDATYIDVLHLNCLKNDSTAQEFVRKGIEITRRLNAGILMTVFFGKCSVTNPQELTAVADAFKPLAHEAEHARVILGFESLLNAEDNLRVFDRVSSPAFKIYYDVGNSTNVVHVNAPAEIRRLGRERICQFHFKDKGYLGEGSVNFPEVLAAIRDIGFNGYANLETNSPSGNMETDLKRNIACMRSLGVG